MASINSDWKDCGKQLSDYKKVVLPRGTETCHESFTAQTWTPPKTRGRQKKLTEAELKEMAQQELKKKEEGKT